MQHELLLAVQHLLPIDAGSGIPQPAARITQDHRKSRQHREPVLVKEPQLVGIDGVPAQADPERVEDGVFGGVVLLHVRKRPSLEPRIVDGHQIETTLAAAISSVVAALMDLPRP